ncbi:MAG: VWA domain-containing protein, partial [Thermoleophilia bacterium]|nr:VWA domain-containing protein [Thermoleophilia bacterium]
AGMRRVLGELAAAGVHGIGLLALNDDGAPSYDHENARAMAALGMPVFACTPDLFPELMAAAISRQDLNTWAAGRDIVAARADEPTA